ncbi:MAG: hypothetical protein ACTHOH_15645 [Lysobacteraceae bacterium]
MRRSFASFSRSLLAFVLLCGALPLSAAQLTPDMTPQQVAAESFERMRAGDWPGAAATFDPAALRQFRGMLGATDDAGKLAPMLQMLLGVDDAAALAKLDDTAFFAGFLKTMMGRMQGMVSLGDQQILGAVPEGDRQVHLVTRNTAEAMGIRMTRMEVVSLNRTPQGWRLALSGQMEGMAEMMRKMSEAGPPPAPATDVAKP